MQYFLQVGSFLASWVYLQAVVDPLQSALFSGIYLENRRKQSRRHHLGICYPLLFRSNIGLRLILLELLVCESVVLLQEKHGVQPSRQSLFYFTHLSSANCLSVLVE